jgi:hypothetical protein
MSTGGSIPVSAKVVADKAGIRARMAKAAALYGEQLTVQFDQLFPPDDVPPVSHPSITRESLVK